MTKEERTEDGEGRNYDGEARMVKEGRKENGEGRW